MHLSGTRPQRSRAVGASVFDRPCQQEDLASCGSVWVMVGICWGLFLC